NAAVTAVALFFVLMTALGTPLGETLTIVIAELAVCAPAAKLVARLVEKKSSTFTIAGSFFVGIIIAPWVVTLANWSYSSTGGVTVSVTAVMAAATIVYAFGEGLGRLACISFGCCYGKPLSQLSLPIQRLFRRWHFVFFGQTKKIAYASGLE